MIKDYTLEKFLDDISMNREFDIIIDNTMYSLTYVKEGFIFTDSISKAYCVYTTYNELLKSVRINGFKLEEIIDKKMYDDISIY